MAATITIEQWKAALDQIDRLENNELARKKTEDELKELRKPIDEMIAKHGK